MFSGIWALPETATGSHVVNRGTPVVPCRLKDPERSRKSHPRGKPLQPSFPKYHELFEEHHRRAADDSRTAKAASAWDSSQSGTCPPRTYTGWYLTGDHHLTVSGLHGPG
jgi:hypothetical protein